MSHVILVGGYPESLINFRGDLIRTLVEAGHEVTAVSAPASRETIAAIQALGAEFRQVPLARSGLNPWSDLRTLLSFYRLFHELKPDAVLAYTIKPVIWGGVALLAIRDIKFHALITGLGFAFQVGNWRRRLLRRIVSFLYRLALRRSDTVTFQNEDNRQFFVSRQIVPQVKSHVVNGSGVNLNHFAVSAFPSGNPIFLVIARLLKEKGLYEFVEAARITKQRHPEAEFRILGPEDPSPDGIPLSEVEGWQEQGLIDYLGATKDVRPAIAGCNVYVLPSYHEGMPRTVLEAMAMGRPIITTDVPGCRSAIKPGVNGYLVPAGDASSLADRIDWFINNKDQWQPMGNASRQLAEEHFDVNKVNAEMLRIMKFSGNCSP